MSARRLCRGTGSVREFRAVVRVRALRNTIPAPAPTAGSAQPLHVNHIGIICVQIVDASAWVRAHRQSAAPESQGRSVRVSAAHVNRLLPTRNLLLIAATPIVLLVPLRHAAMP